MKLFCGCNCLNAQIINSMLFIDLGVPEGKMKVLQKVKLLLPIFFFVSFSYLSLCAENNEVVKYQRQLTN